MGPLDNSRHEKFSQLVASGKSDLAAYVEAGFSKSNAKGNACRLRENQGVLQRIRSLRQKSVAKVEKELEIDTDWVKRQYLDVVVADPSDLAEIIICACRHCHGLNNAYQWRNAAEHQQAHLAWLSLPEKLQAKTPPPPETDGGFGWSRRLTPHFDCPECDGYGAPQTILRPTRGNPLFAGIKQNQFGTEIVLHDRMKAVESLGRILGVFKDEKGAASDTDKLLQSLRDLINKTGQGPVLNYGARAEIAIDVTPRESRA